LSKRKIDPNCVIGATVDAIHSALDADELIAAYVGATDPKRRQEWIERLIESRARIDKLIQQLGGKKAGRHAIRSAGMKMLIHALVVEYSQLTGDDISKVCERLGPRLGISSDTLRRRYYDGEKEAQRSRTIMVVDANEQQVKRLASEFFPERSRRVQKLG
jgi:hypothetical protein